MKKDIALNRKSREWSRMELGMRLLWDCAQVLFRASPRLLWGWRTGILRLFGARIGRNVHIYPSVRIMIPWNLEIGDETAIGDSAILYALGKITLGQRVTVSQGAHLCAGTHDYRVAARPLLKLPITIGDDCWIAADAFIGPNVTVGREAIVGARAVVVKDVPDRAILVGNPARVVGTTTTAAPR